MTGSLQVEETSAYCTVNHRASASNYQLSNMKRPVRDSNWRPQRLEARTLTATPLSPLQLSICRDFFHQINKKLIFYFLMMSLINGVIIQTEFLIAGTPQQRAKVLFDSLSVSGTIVPASPYVKNIGSIIDKELT